MVDDHFLFKEGDRFLESCGLNREWPEARGIYHNDAKTFLVWDKTTTNKVQQFLSTIITKYGLNYVGLQVNN